MNVFCERLKKERQRLGLNQEQFAAIGGVKKGAQLNYENGSRKPDSDYLAAIAAAGVDVLFLINGEICASKLTGEEAELLVGYREMDTRAKAGVLGMIKGFTTPQPAATVVFHGKVAQNVQGDVTAPFSINMGDDKPDSQ